MSQPDTVSERRALATVQAMLREGASVDAVQSFITQTLGPVPPITAKKGSRPLPADAKVYWNLDATPLTGNNKASPPASAALQGEKGDRPLHFTLPSVISGATVSLASAVAEGGGGGVVAPTRTNNNNDMAPLPELHVHSATSPSRGRPVTSAVSTALSTPATTSPSKYTPAAGSVSPRSAAATSGGANQVVRPEARREINAFIDGTYTRVPMPRSNASAASALSARAVGSATATPNRGLGSATAAQPPSPKMRRETVACALPLSLLDPVEMVMGSASVTSDASSSVGQLPLADMGRPAQHPSWPSSTQPNSGVAETPTYHGKRSFRVNASGAGSTQASSPGIHPNRAMVRERRVSVTDSLAAANDSNGDSLVDGSMDSGLVAVASFHRANLSGYHMAGLSRSVMSGPAMALNHRRRNSILTVTGRHRHIGTDRGNDSEADDLQEFSDVLWPEWSGEGGADGGLPGPRFARTGTRETDAHVPLEETKRLLAELAVPYLPQLHHEGGTGSTTTTNETGIAAAQVDPVAIAEQYGTESFVYIAMNCFLRYSFVARFGFSIQKLHAFMQEAFSFFRLGNPLHHPIHAADILIAAHQWLCQPSVAANLADEEVLAFLFSAAVMRVGHSGIDNRLLTQMRHPYAMMCSYCSPQQGATVALVMALLEKPHCRFFPRIFHTKAVEDSPTASAGSSNSATTPATTTTTTTTTTAQQSGALTDANAAFATQQKHEWTQYREYQFFDFVSELVMATDERNHFEFHSGIMEILNDHFRSHGCLCPVKIAPNGDGAVEEERYATLACRNCCCYISDAHLPKVLKAVLHFIDGAYLFRPYEVFLVGAVATTTEYYRQQECQMRLLSVTERIQRAAMEQEALKQGAGASGSSSLGEAVAMATAQALCPDAENAAAAVAAGDSDIVADMVGRAEAGFLSEQPVWRTDALHSSTLSALRTLEAMPKEVVGKMLQPPRPHHQFKRTSCTNEEDDARSLSQHSMPTVTFSAARYRHALQGHGRDILLVALEDLYFPFLSDLAPYLPKGWALAGRRNYERLLAEMPTPEEYNAVVEKVLHITDDPDFAPAAAADGTPAAAGADGLLGGLPSVAELRRSVPMAKYIPFELIARLVPAQPRWHFDANGLEGRILTEITQVGRLWVSFGAMSKALRETAASASGGSDANSRPTGANAEGKPPLKVPASAGASTTSFTAAPLPHHAK